MTVKKVIDYYDQRMYGLLIIIGQQEDSMLSKDYLLEKLDAIHQGVFSMHHSVEQQVKDDLWKQEWVPNLEFRKIRMRLKLMEEL